jgi:hypothetical protein
VAQERLEALRCSLAGRNVACLICPTAWPLAGQPIATAIQACGGNFILTCKPSSHQTIAEYLAGAEFHEHRQTVSQPGKRATHIYRWLAAVPLRASEDAITVNWFSLEIFNATGKRTYYNSFVTDLPITAETVPELAAAGRPPRTQSSW